MTYFTGLGLAVFWGAIAAFVGNRAAFYLFGRRAAVLAVPWWEEACKALAFRAVPGVPMLFVHVLFGALECTYDCWRSPNDGLFLGVLSLAGHGFFGGVAMLTFARTGNLWWAYLVAGLAHSLYNLAVVSLVLPILGAGAYAGAQKR